MVSIKQKEASKIEKDHSEMTVGRYWCISTSTENWKICKANNVWGMDARYSVTLENRG